MATKATCSHKSGKSTHHWYCVGCQQRKPLQGFDIRKRLCSDCQGQDRPAIEVFVAAIRTGYLAIPPYLIRAVLIAMDQADPSSGGPSDQPSKSQCPG